MDEAERKAKRAAYMREYVATGTNGSCNVEGCERPMYGRTGLCPMHYQRRRVLGDVGEPEPRFLHDTPEARFWRFVNRDNASGCWLWTAAKTPDGYAHFLVKGRKGATAHRFAYELLVGPIPEGKQLDHLCRVRHCVNPAHLEPVTQTENIRRGAPATKTHCKRGHDLTDPANLKPNGRGARQCRACSNLARMERYRRLGK